ncbi:hypothetical protein CR513_56949, partial [Mucuna pruriens]
MSNVWRKKILVLIFKKKKFRTENVFEHKLRELTKIADNQFGFMIGRLTTKVNYILTEVDGKIHDMYEGVTTSMRTLRDKAKDFPIGIE